jgi:hypothetical protein
MTAGVWGGVSVALDLTSFIPFIWAALSGRARPSRISWSMWSAEYWVLFGSEVAYGSGLDRRRRGSRIHHASRRRLAAIPRPPQPAQPPLNPTRPDAPASRPGPRAGPMAPPGRPG